MVQAEGGGGGGGEGSRRRGIKHQRKQYLSVTQLQLKLV